MAQINSRQYAHSIGMSASNITNKSIDDFPSLVAPDQFVLRSALPNIAGAVTVGAVAYFVYLGRTRRALAAQKVLFHVSTVGSGAQVGEVGIFSSPTAPNRAAQTLTKIVATGTLDDLAVGTGVKGNTTAFNTTVDAGVELWAGYRVDMAGTEPTVWGLTADMSHGQILSLPAAAALTSTTTFAGALITAAVVWQCPALTLHVS